MKFFAIILASVAALAATGQAYLIWKQQTNESQPQEVERSLLLLPNFGSRGSKRVGTCENLIDSFYTISVLVDEQDQIMSNWTDVNLGDIRQRQDRRLDTETKQLEEARRRAETQLIREHKSQLRSVLDFRNKDHVYFVEEEVRILDFDIVSDLPPVMRIGRLGFQNALSADSYSQTISVMAELSTKKDVVTQLCTNILKQEAEKERVPA